MRAADAPRRLAPDSALPVSLTEGRPSDVVDPPDFAVEHDDVGGVTDDLERDRPVQPGDDGRDATVGVDPHQGPRIRQRRLTGSVPAHTPIERAKSVRPRPSSTSTASLAPAATTVGDVASGVNAMTLPSAGRWGRGPASAMYIVCPETASPVGTTLPNAIRSGSRALVRSRRIGDAKTTKCLREIHPDQWKFR